MGFIGSGTGKGMTSAIAALSIVSVITMAGTGTEVDVFGGNNDANPLPLSDEDLLGMHQRSFR